MSNTYLTAALSLAGSEVFSASEAPSGASVSQRTLAVTGADMTASLDAQSTPKLEVSPIVRRITISGTTTIDLTAAAGAALPIAASHARRRRARSAGSPWGVKRPSSSAAPRRAANSPGTAASLPSSRRSAAQREGDSAPWSCSTWCPRSARRSPS